MFSPRSGNAAAEKGKGPLIPPVPAAALQQPEALVPASPSFGEQAASPTIIDLRSPDEMFQESFTTPSTPKSKRSLEFDNGGEDVPDDITIIDMDMAAGPSAAMAAGPSAAPESSPLRRSPRKRKFEQLPDQVDLPEELKLTFTTRTDLYQALTMHEGRANKSI